MHGTMNVKCGILIQQFSPKRLYLPAKLQGIKRHYTKLNSTLFKLPEDFSIVCSTDTKSKTDFCLITRHS
jgi:hypothetical protein